MPAISFSTLKDKILSGEKKQTIRPKLSDYWLRFKKGDRLVGYWMLRQGGEKLFDSEFIENPFIATYHELMCHDDWMVMDGFRGVSDAYVNWFRPHYGDMYPHQMEKEFVVIRWI
jgi:hypothetical protein